jgi:hypothetical protein
MIWLLGEMAEFRERTATADEVTYRRTYLVRTDNDHIGPRAVSFCPGLPLLNYPFVAPLESDPLVRVVKRSASPHNGHRRLWQVQVEFSSNHGPDDQGEEEQIELEPPDVSFDFGVRMRALTGKAEIVGDTENPGALDATGYTNSAGEPFDPPPEKEEHFPILEISRNELVLDPARIRQYVNTTNEDPFLGGPPNTVKMAGISARKQYKKNLRYWRVTYRMEFREEDWNLKLLDIGSYHLEFDEVLKRVHFITDDEPPQPRLGLLNGFGRVLDEGFDPQFRVFKIYEQNAFAALQLQQAIDF